MSDYDIVRRDLLRMVNLSQSLAALDRIEAREKTLFTRIEAAIQHNELAEDAPWLADVLWPERG